MSVKPMVVLDVNEYERLINEKKEEEPADQQEDVVESNEAIPDKLLLLIESLPVRIRSKAMLILKYLASSGRFLYNVDTGWIYIDKWLPSSNLADILMELLCPKIGQEQSENFTGITELLNILIDSAMPANIIINKYYREIVRKERNSTTDTTD